MSCLNGISLSTPINTEKALDSATRRKKSFIAKKKLHCSDWGSEPGEPFSSVCEGPTGVPLHYMTSKDKKLILFILTNLCTTASNAHLTETAESKHHYC